MENQISNWNGFKVHGDTSELDKIVNHQGKIRLDFNDIIYTLSESGENHIADGVGLSLIEALNVAVLKLPVSIREIEKLLIQVYIGAQSPMMAEFSAVSQTLSNLNNDLQVMFGVSKTGNPEPDTKVVLVYSLSE